MNTGDKCPQCGYVQIGAPVLQSNVMSTYIDDADPKGPLNGVYNSKTDYLEVKGKKLRRSDVVKPVATTVPTSTVKK